MKESRGDSFRAGGALHALLQSHIDLSGVMKMVRSSALRNVSLGVATFLCEFDEDLDELVDGRRWVRQAGRAKYHGEHEHYNTKEGNLAELKWILEMHLSNEDMQQYAMEPKRFCALV